LLRKRAGLLLLTRAGLAMRSDPVALWWHLAERMPVSSRDACEQQAGLLRLVLTAAQAAGDHEAMIARMLSAIGWVVADGWPLTEHVALRASRYTERCSGGSVPLPTSRTATARMRRQQGENFARAALRTRLQPGLDTCWRRHLSRSCLISTASRRGPRPHELPACFTRRCPP
jgi:hypothetical protein